MAAAAAQRATAASSEAVTTLLHQQSEDWRTGGVRWEAAGKFAGLSQADSSSIADAALAGAAHAVAEHRTKRWASGHDYDSLAKYEEVDSTELESGPTPLPPARSAASRQRIPGVSDFDRANAREQFQKSAPRDKLEEIRARARGTGGAGTGCSGIAAWRMQLEQESREGVDATPFSTATAPSARLGSWARTASLASGSTVETLVKAARGDGDLFSALRRPSTSPTSTTPNGASGVSLLLAALDREQGAGGSAGGRHVGSAGGGRAADGGRAGGGKPDAWKIYQQLQAPSRAQMERRLKRFSLSHEAYNDLPGEIGASDATELARERAETAAAAAEHFEEVHKSAGRQALIALRSGRNAAHMGTRVGPYYAHALTTLRRNRLGLSGVDPLRTHVMYQPSHSH